MVAGCAYSTSAIARVRTKSDTSTARRITTTARVIVPSRAAPGVTIPSSRAEWSSSRVCARVCLSCELCHRSRRFELNDQRKSRLAARSLEVSLSAADLATSVQWYCDVLGFLVKKQYKR